MGLLNDTFSVKTEEDAIKLQEEYASHLTFEDEVPNPRYIAGADVGYTDDETKAIGAMVVFDARDMSVVCSYVGIADILFPYIPGCFSFREIPALMKAYDGLTTKPDLIICDGQGFAHPRRFGMACHLGLLLDTATIGCAKTRLIGEHKELSPRRGAGEFLIDKGQVIGYALRTQEDMKPLYISPGHKISLSSAGVWVLNTAHKYRLPEPIRAADHITKIA